VGPPRGHKPGQQTCSSVGSSLHGSTGPGRSLLEHGLPIGSQPLPGIPLLWRGVQSGLQVEICTTVGLHGLQGHSLPHRGLLHGLQGNLFSGLWSTSSPSFYSELGVCRVVALMYLYSSLRLPLLVFFPLLTCVILEALPPSLMGSTLPSSGSILELTGTGSTGHGGSF